MPKLMKFQEEDVRALAPVRARLLGHDMGLGKTPMAIALDKAARENALEKATAHYDRLPPTLIVAPMSVLSTWVEHLAEWQPELAVEVIDRKSRWKFEKALEKRTADAYIMHWDVVRLVPQLAERRWLHVIGDEIHRIGNRDAQVTQAFKRHITTLYKTGASGSPAETRPQDLWSVLNWLYPRVYTSYWRFFNHYVIHKYHTAGGCQVEDCFKEHKNAYREIVGVAHEEELHEQMSTYYRRRLKEDVLEDFPDKYYTEIVVDLDDKQRRAYDQMRDQMLSWIGDNEDQPLAASMAIAKLVRLQQLSAAYANMVTVTKRRKATEDDNWARERKGLPPVAFIEYQADVVQLIEPSTKLDAVMQLLTDNPTKQFVVFSVSRQVCELLARRLEKAKITHGLFTGLTPLDKRTEIRHDFQAGKLRVFVGTIKAGGQGITLTASNTMIFIDREWSAFKNGQAEDREWRFGQKNAVQVIDIIGRDTVDLGRLQKFVQSWEWLKRLLGDKIVPDAQARKPFERVT